MERCQPTTDAARAPEVGHALDLSLSRVASGPHSREAAAGGGCVLLRPLAPAPFLDRRHFYSQLSHLRVRVHWLQCRSLICIIWFRDFVVYSCSMKTDLISTYRAIIY